MEYTFYKGDKMKITATWAQEAKEYNTEVRGDDVNKCLSCDKPHNNDIRWVIDKENFCFKCAINIIALLSSIGVYPPSIGREDVREKQPPRQILVAHYNDGSYIVHDMGQ